MPLCEKGSLLTGVSEGLNVVGENGEFSFGAVQRNKDLGIVMTTNYKWAEQRKAAARKSRGDLLGLLSAISCRNVKVFIPLCKTIVRLCLEYCIQAWTPSLKRKWFASSTQR